MTENDRYITDFPFARKYRVGCSLKPTGDRQRGKWLSSEDDGCSYFCVHARTTEVSVIARIIRSGCVARNRLEIYNFR